MILAGSEYGSGSSRDWARKGTALLGLRAVIANRSSGSTGPTSSAWACYHCQFRTGENAATVGLTGAEPFAITGITALNSDETPREVTVRADDTEFTALVRIDTPGEAT